MLSLIESFNWRRLSDWRSLALQALAIAVFVIAVTTLIVVVLRAFFNSPPIRIETQNKTYLGELCPGNPSPIVNTVTVKGVVWLYYTVSVQDSMGLENIFGTQRNYVGFPHVREGKFVQVIPWEVPALPPGEYLRIFMARGTDGEERPVWIETRFTVTDRCD